MASAKGRPGASGLGVLDLGKAGGLEAKQIKRTQSHMPRNPRPSHKPVLKFLLCLLSIPLCHPLGVVCVSYPREGALRAGAQDW